MTRFPAPPRDGKTSATRKLLMPLGVVGAILLKFKALLLPVLKFFPILLKTGGTMVLSIWAYATMWGVWFAVGFVLLILVHECGHMLAARQSGLKVGAPVFIPFMGAMVALKEAPRNAWIEAKVAIGGPLLGTLGAVVCLLLYPLTGNPLFAALAYTGFFLNLINLAPVGPLDGGRVVTALSPWIWLVGIAIAGLLLVKQFNFLLFVILLTSLPRLFALFRPKSEDEKRYFEVSPRRRMVMASLYFGLALFLVVAMEVALVAATPR